VPVYTGLSSNQGSLCDGKDIPHVSSPQWRSVYRTYIWAVVTCRSTGEFDYITGVHNSTTSVNALLRYQSTS